MTDLRITATDASTVITGAANVHRFDAPSSREIAATVRGALGPDPAGAQVHIAADPPRLRELVHALSDYDIELTTEALEPPAAPLPDDAPTDTFRPVHPPQEERSGAWIVAAVVAVVALMCAGAIWAITRGGEGTTAQPHATSEPQAPEQSRDPEPQTEPVQGEAERTSIGESPTVRLERDGLSVQLPAGFALEADEGMWRATGADPNFRLQIAAERLYQLPTQTMAEQLLADIEADPEVELVDTDGVAVTYLERAADGSQSLWRTWPDGAVQLFVGCHTRFEPTVVQRATCRMAMESAAYEGADVGP